MFETHFHADFVSGHHELQKQTKAQIVFGDLQENYTNFQKTKDNQIFNIGDIQIQVLHTPGHTMESACYLLLH